MADDATYDDATYDEQTQVDYIRGKGHGILSKMFSSCAEDPQGSVHRAWGITLLFIVIENVYSPPHWRIRLVFIFRIASLLRSRVALFVAILLFALVCITFIATATAIVVIGNHRVCHRL